MKTTPWLTIITIFYNNQREAERTLFTLSSAYQEDVLDSEYQVLAIDNNSPKPLKEEEVTKFGKNFKYHFFKTDLPSPCAALNWGIKQAKTPYVMCIIDGAHMLSPRVLIETKSVLSAFPNGFVYTLPFHLGETLQNESMLRGYNQKEEDKLLESINWKENGYGLFFISEVRDANHSFFTPVNESNCFTISKEKILEKGGFDERFTSIGGGLTNLDVFNKLVTDEEVKTVALVGEASFHQFHGGVSTNIERKEHPIIQFKEEYRRIKGMNYDKSTYVPYYWGSFKDEIRSYMPVSGYREVLILARKIAASGKVSSAVDMLLAMKPFQKQHPIYYNTLGFCYEREQNWVKAANAYKESLKLAEDDNIIVKLASVLMNLENYDEAIEYLEKCEKHKFDNAHAFLKKAQIYATLGHHDWAMEAFDESYNILIGESKFQAIVYIEALRFCLDRSKLVEAEKIVEIAIGHYPKGYHFKNFLARIYMRKKRIGDAKKILSEVLELVKPEQRFVFYISLSDCYKIEGNKTKALEILYKAKKQFPENKNLDRLIQRLEK